MKKLSAYELHQLWLQHTTLTFQEKSRLKSLNPEEIKALFFIDGTEFQFGTAGIRSLVGIGPRKLNIHTFRVLADAYAQFLLTKKSKSSVLVSYDNRENGKLFANAICRVLSFHGIPTLLTSITIPTPIMAFYVKRKQLKGGIMITASHNPPEYNGFKLYDERGGQLSQEEESEIRSLFKPVEEYLEINWNSYSKIPTISNECFNEYAISIQKELGIKLGGFYSLGSTIIRTIKFLFSSHHGTSSGRMVNLAKMMGSQKFKEYAPECTPSFSIPEDEIINPEDPSSFKNMEREANRLQIDYLMAHDPDSDRSATAEFDGKEWYHFTGNEIALLSAAFLLELSKIPKYKIQLQYKYLVTTYVSGDFIDKVVKYLNPEIEIIRTDTGFRNIGQTIEKYSKLGEILLGCEEAIGISIFPSLSLEKDGFQQTLLTMYMIGYYKFHSKNLITHLYSLMWELKTVWLGKTVNFNLSNLLEKAYIYDRLNKISNSNQKIKIEDYVLEALRGESNEIFMFKVENSESWIKARFSGTEFKFKLYFNFYGNISDEEASNNQNSWMKLVKEIRLQLSNKISSLSREIYKLLKAKN